MKRELLATVMYIHFLYIFLNIQLLYRSVSLLILKERIILVRLAL